MLQSFTAIGGGITVYVFITCGVVDATCACFIVICCLGAVPRLYSVAAWT